jgi:hypothetical protein
LRYPGHWILATESDGYKPLGSARKRLSCCGLLRRNLTLMHCSITRLIKLNMFSLRIADGTAGERTRRDGCFVIGPHTRSKLLANLPVHVHKNQSLTDLLQAKPKTVQGRKFYHTWTILHDVLELRRQNGRCYGAPKFYGAISKRIGMLTEHAHPPKYEPA